ncbi:MAG TPA: APC family permease [Solirubrobacteraceae bacterium]|nr:APC family permease [Thermoleophilia bacterium]HVP03848.1 APC family permease [Solirubrobacteraceae bacterium]
MSGAARESQGAGSLGGTPAGRTRVLGVWSVVMISVGAVFTLRNLPSVAEYGWSSIFYYALGALIFFVPLSLVVAELGTSWPQAGGLYVWVKQGFGDSSGFLAVWFDFIENVPSFPVVLSFSAATLAYAVDPSLASNKTYLVIAMLTIFWGLTVANLFGMRWSARLNNPSVVLGTLLPGALLIALGVYWLASGRHNQTPLQPGKLAPHVGSVNDMVFFVGVLLAYGGMEMAGFHAKETRTPARTIPRAFLIAAIIIICGYVLATLPVAYVVPQAHISLVAGVLQAFQAYFSAIGLGAWATKAMALLVGLGSLALISTWLLGPAKGLYATEQAGDIMPAFQYVNKRHVPVAILLAEGVATSLFALLFLFVPSINTGYWMLTALTTQLVLLMYLQVFASAIRLRYTEPNVARPYRIPGGKAGIWIVGGIGLFGCLFGFVMGFVPPAGIKHWPTPLYVLAMAVGIVITSAPPFIVEKVKKRSWIPAHPDEVLVDTGDTESSETGGEAANAAAAAEGSRDHTRTPGRDQRG